MLMSFFAVVFPLFGSQLLSLILPSLIYQAYSAPCKFWSPCYALSRTGPLQLIFHFIWGLLGTGVLASLALSPLEIVFKRT